MKADGLKNTSVLLDKMLTAWIEQVEPQQRQVFAQFLFDALESPGVDTFNQLNQNRMKNYGEIIKTALSMDKNRRDEFIRVLSELARQGTSALTEEIKKYLPGKMGQDSARETDDSKRIVPSTQGTDASERTVPSTQGTDASERTVSSTQGMDESQESSL